MKFPCESCGVEDHHDDQTCGHCGGPVIKEKMDEQEIIAAMLRVEDFNDQFRQPNPNGRYPICKPRLFDIEYCERCNSWIKGVDGPCPAIPPEQRWGKDYVPHAE